MQGGSGADKLLLLIVGLFVWQAEGSIVSSTPYLSTYLSHCPLVSSKPKLCLFLLQTQAQACTWLAVNQSRQHDKELLVSCLTARREMH